MTMMMMMMMIMMMMRRRRRKNDNDDDGGGDDDDDDEDEDEGVNAEDEVEDEKVGDDDVEKEEDDVEEDDVEEEGRSQDRDPHFARACAIEMHVNISEEPLYTEIYRKNVVPQIESRTRTHILCEPAQSKCTSTFQKTRFIRKFPGKMPRPKTAAQTLCEPAQSKCTSTFHKSNFIRKFTGKMLFPEPRTTLCASLRSRNALQHFTRATLYGNLQEKGARQSEHLIKHRPLHLP